MDRRLLKSSLDYLDPYDAGLFPEDIVRKYKIPPKDVVNISSNEFPYEPPKAVVDAIKKAASGVNRYSKPLYSDLKGELSGYTGADAKNIAVGNGASDILDTLCKITISPFDKVVIPIPTFTMYLFLSILRDATLVFADCNGDGFNINSGKILPLIDNSVKMVFLCSPNSPTGRPINKNEICRVVENTNGIVVVDEAYAEFSGQTMADKIDEYDNLVVVRSMSKYFGLAGLRVGYMLANEKIVNAMESARMPFTINNLAKIAAIEALKNKAWYDRMQKKIIEDREKLTKDVNGINGFKAYKSEANFILIKSDLNLGDRNLSNMLHETGILVRDVTNVMGVRKKDETSQYIRVTVGTPEENRKFVDALKRVGKK